MKAKSGYHAHELRLPDVDTVDGLFSHVERFKQDRKTLRTLNEGPGFYALCSGHPAGHLSLWVRPTAAVKRVMDEMRGICDDVLYFEFVHRGDEILVTVRYNKIIGSRWLTFLPPDALDAWAKQD